MIGIAQQAGLATHFDRPHRPATTPIGPKPPGRGLVRVFQRGQLVKVHPRTGPGGPVTDPADLPTEKTTYALREIDHLKRLAAQHGPAVGADAAAVLDHPSAAVHQDAPRSNALMRLVKR